MNQTSFEAVKKHFYSIVQIPEREWRKFEVFLFSRSLKKGAYFIQEGDRCYDVGLITTGLIKRFLITEAGKEYVHYFAADGDWVGAYHTALLGIPSRINNIALEDTELILFDFKKYQKLYDQHPCWERIGRKTAEKLFIDRENREFQFLTFSAEKLFHHTLSRPTSSRILLMLFSSYHLNYYKFLIILIG